MPGSGGHRMPGSGGHRTTPGRAGTSESSISTWTSSGGESTVHSRRKSIRLVSKVWTFCFSPATSGSPRAVAQFPHHSFPSASSASSASTNKSIYGPGRSTHSEAQSIHFTLADINKATKKFSSSNKIGEGSFGTVYRGVLQDGTLVAVKRANKEDKNSTVTFHNEISTLEQIKHLNLVKFWGYVEHKDEQIIVSEYVPNGTLREHLDCVHGKPLDFSSRLEIAIDIAHAITYLHMYTDNPIIHRDIKSTNILLTDNLRAKVADFGFARLGATDCTHVLTEVKGTIGYLDPHYLVTNQLTVKSDVYSFGILLLELVSGRVPIDSSKRRKDQQTAKWAKNLYGEGNSVEVLDPNIPRTPATNVTVDKILMLVFKCLDLSTDKRPSMKWCVEILWEIRKDHKAMLSSDDTPSKSHPQ